jgi:hypothetical protein
MRHTCQICRWADGVVTPATVVWTDTWSNVAYCERHAAAWWCVEDETS